MIETGSGPDSDYTRTWSPLGEINYLELADGTRTREHMILVLKVCCIQRAMIWHFYHSIHLKARKF